HAGFGGDDGGCAVRHVFPGEALRGRGRGVGWVREGRRGNCWGLIWFPLAHPALRWYLHFLARLMGKALEKCRAVTLIFRGRVRVGGGFVEQRALPRPIPPLD